MRMLTSRTIATAAAAAIALTTFSLQPAAAGSRNDAAALAAFAAVFGTIAAVVAAEHYRDRPHYERSYNYGPVDRGPHPHGDWKHYRRW